MIETLLLTLPTLTVAAPIGPAAGPAPGVPAWPAIQADQDDQDVEKAIEAAGEDVAKLIELAEGWATAGEDASARAAYERVLEIEEDNETAHKGLGHHHYDNKWFETYASLSKYRRAIAKEMLEKYGKVRVGDEWVLKEDVPFLRMGWIKQDGRWMHPADKERADQEAKYRAEGWQQQDLVWVHPDEFDKWRAQLWKVGEEWLSIEDADAYHAELDQWWEIPGEHFIALTTVARNSGGWMIPVWADRTYADLVRIFGKEPETRPRFLTVNGIPQYNVFAGGDPATGRQPSEGTGYSSVHYAFFAESSVDLTTTPISYNGMGVCYWDVNDEGLKGYGQHAVRHAAAHSFIEAIDPSWDYISRVISDPTTQPQPAAFWDEKLIPLWLRYGAASYVERFFEDTSVDPATGNPLWAREWGLANLRGRGTREFDELFAFQIDPNDPEDSGTMIAEAGLVVAFILDGKCGPVTEAHQAFKAALQEGKDTDEAVQALQKAVIDNEKRFRLYSNIPARSELSATEGTGEGEQAGDGGGR